jgi:hypothetical protein
MAFLRSVLREAGDGGRQRTRAGGFSPRGCWCDLDAASVSPAPPLVATVLDMARGLVRARQGPTRPKIIHARSTVPAALASVLRRRDGTPWVFDTSRAPVQNRRPHRAAAATRCRCPRLPDPEDCDRPCCLRDPAPLGSDRNHTVHSGPIGVQTRCSVPSCSPAGRISADPSGGGDASRSCPGGARVRPRNGDRAVRPAVPQGARRWPLRTLAA